MQRTLAVLARAYLPWIVLLALVAGATSYWLHLHDDLLANLNGLSMMAGLETLSAADPGPGGGLGPAPACGEQVLQPCASEALTSAQPAR